MGEDGGQFSCTLQLPEGVTPRPGTRVEYGVTDGRANAGAVGLYYFHRRTRGAQRRKLRTQPTSKT